MIVLAVDPGNEQSALVWYDADARRVVAKRKIANEEALGHFIDNVGMDIPIAGHLAIEMAESFGAKVWAQVFTTVLWTGRFIQAWHRPYTLITRREVKLHITGSPRAKDGQIRQCLIERWGGAEKALGTKKQPGPLRGVVADQWAAFAVAVTYAEGAGGARLGGSVAAATSQADSITHARTP